MTPTATDPAARAARSPGAEDGWAVVTAMMLMVIMLLIGLAALSRVDTQEDQANTQRLKESAFNLAEAAVEAQSVRMTANWPQTATAALPASCSFTLPASPSANPLCPDPNHVAPAFGGSDVPAGSALTTAVRDNIATDGSPDSYYDPATITSRPTWDENLDGRMWVRADATVRGRTRAVVALVQTGRAVVPFPRQLVIAGKIATSGLSSGTVAYDTQDGSTIPMSVRCAHAASGSTAGCVDVARPGQIAPDTLAAGVWTSETAVDRGVQEALKMEAQQSGLFYPAGSCPPNLTTIPDGRIVYVENISGCSIPTSGETNSHGNPGVLVIERGKLTLAGTFKHEGLIYHLNLDRSTDYMVDLTAASKIHGAALVDFGGGVMARSTDDNLKYNENTPWPDLPSLSDSSVVRGSWRELPLG